MKRYPLSLLILLCLTTSVAAQNIVHNADFSTPREDNPNLPAQWTVAPGSPWSRQADTGPQNGPALAYRGDAGPAAPVVQECDFATPNTQHRLRAYVRSDGRLTPVLRVVDRTNEAVLLSVTARPETAWHEISGTFAPANADLRVEIFGHPSHVAGENAPAGEAWVTQVQVMVAVLDTGPAVPDIGENIALGKPYTMPDPNYSLCADPDDNIHLTDGEFTQGHFWTRGTTVGWSTTRHVGITVDLGDVYPIKGAMFSTAAGVADVAWPSAIIIMVSSDGENWYDAGDLISLYTKHQRIPEQGEYHAIRLWTDKLETHGRYVSFNVMPEGRFVFCDEIQVYRGDDAWLDKEYAGPPISDISQYMVDLVANNLVRNQMLRDLKNVERGIALLPEDQRADFITRAAALDTAVNNHPFVDVHSEDFDAILPLSDVHRDVFRLQAAVWRARGFPALQTWFNPRWDPLEPANEPENNAQPLVDVHMMANEYRAGTFNLNNATDEDMQLTLRITGLPGGDNPDYISVHEVLSVGTRRHVAVSAALPEAARTDAGHTIHIPSGMTRQMWLSFNKVDLPAGTYEGQVQVSGAGQQATVPIQLTVYPLRFPDETTLLVGGWSYTNNETMYGITPQNRAAVIEHLQERYVNAPWATSAAMPNGTFDADGNYVTLPDTTNFDNWVALWPDAKMYLVYKAVGPVFEGEEMGTEMFNKKVGNWARFWSDHMLSKGMQPSQLGILLYDEPMSKDKYDLTVAWVRAIRPAAPELVMWVDPQPYEDQDCLEMFSVMDVLCIYRNPFLARPDWYRELFMNEQAMGRELWFYNADGPARTFDPFSYYLLQQWHAFKIDARGSCFWAFADNGRVSCWNEYPAQTSGPYCPVYIDDESITAAKYMEAIREGIQDYEYLIMLRDRVNELAARGVAEAQLAAARDLLANGPDRVLAMEKGSNYRWDEEKDRSVTDRVRVEILQALTALAEL